MDYHHHARLTLVRREELARRVLEGRLSSAKWVKRYREQGVAGLRDRSSRPHRSPRGTSEERIVEIERLRRERWTGVRIAQRLGLSAATVSRVLRRLKLNRIRDLEPKLPPNRYEHAAPGDMVHSDIKRLVRIARPSHRVTGDRRPRHGHRCGVPACGYRRPLAACLYRHVSGSKGGVRKPLPGRGHSLVRAPRHRDPAHPHRQRPLLQGPPLRPSVSSARLETPPHPALHPTHQRQGRALHQNRHQQMGLRADLPELRGKNRFAAHLESPIQLASTPRQPQPTSADQQTPVQ